MKIFAVAVTALSVITSAASSITDNTAVADHQADGVFDILQDPIALEMFDIFLKYSSGYSDVKQALNNVIVYQSEIKEDSIAIANSTDTSFEKIDEMMEENHVLYEKYAQLLTQLKAKYS